jgi:hypothetical protein
MSRIALSGNLSGTGTLTFAAPNTNTDRTLDLPDAAGTIQVSGNPISGTTGTFTGLVDISAAGAGQIAFPATQNASANANTLDDYEEGTWTASISSQVNMSGATWSSGTYTKIGNLVTIQGSFSCTITSSNTLTYASLTLPFAATSAQTGVAFANDTIKVGVSDLSTSAISPFFPVASAVVSGSETIQVAATYITTT